MIARDVPSERGTQERRHIDVWVAEVFEPGPYQVDGR